MATTPAPWWVFLLPALFSAPWVAAVVYFWRHRPRDGAIPLSMADAARQRLWPR